MFPDPRNGPTEQRRPSRESCVCRDFGSDVLDQKRLYSLAAYTAVPMTDPTAAVSVIASAPQRVTRPAPRKMPAPPV